MGRAVANRRGVNVGDKFSIGDLSVVIAGIFRLRGSRRRELHLFAPGFPAAKQGHESGRHRDAAGGPAQDGFGRRSDLSND